MQAPEPGRQARRKRQDKAMQKVAQSTRKGEGEGKTTMLQFLGSLNPQTDLPQG